jgi:hypothetical protein
MQMYMWRNEALKNYGQGHLVAIAETPEQARKKLRDGFFDYLKEHYGWMFDILDEEGIEEKRNLIEKDLIPEPTVTELLYITGSE